MDQSSLPSGRPHVTLDPLTPQPTNVSLLARVFGTYFTVQIGNPAPQPALIELRLRRLSLPPDWTASVTPITVTLQPGQAITATILIRPGAAAPQGFRAKLAVEGFVENTLLGGVLLEIAVPQPAPFNPQTQHKVYLPLTVRN